MSQNQLKISEGGKWNSHQMPCVYSSRMVKKSRICPIRIEIIHGRHRVVQIYTWAGPLYSNFTLSDSEGENHRVEGGKWSSHQMPCVYSSRMVKNYRICPIRIEIIHGRHRVVK
jgi:RES domain-containing protein